MGHRSFHQKIRSEKKIKNKKERKKEKNRKKKKRFESMSGGQ